MSVPIRTLPAGGAARGRQIRKYDSVGQLELLQKGFSLAERKHFGTDGVRGIANTELSPTFAMSLGAAAAIVLSNPEGTQQHSEVIVGRDPRVSGDILESALVAGLCSLGVNVTALGVLPTPAVAFCEDWFNAASFA